MFRSGFGTELWFVIFSHGIEFHKTPIGNPEMTFDPSSDNAEHFMENLVKSIVNTKT